MWRRLLREQLEPRLQLAADISETINTWGVLSGHGGACTCPICTGQGLDGIPLPAEIDLSGSAQSPLGDSAQAPLTSQPQLHSLSTASAKLFLDFDGHFEATWGSRTNATTPAFDQDGDPTTFSAGELAAINEIWTRVSEDYAPYNIDVTTVDPGNQTNKLTAVIAIGGSYQDWYGAAAGGVAYIGGFYNLSPNVGYVFSGSLSGSAKNTSEAAAHEAGHLFGLQHQATWSGTTLVTEYNSGNGAWAPIMGVGYSATRTTWYNGPTSAGPTAYQDDMSILAGGFNGFGYRPDDYGGTIATATTLPAIGTSVNFSGLIGQANDLDVWSFSTGGGTVTFQLTGAQYGTNLDAVLELRNSSGAVVISDAPSNSLGASLTSTLGAGTYYLVARSVGDYGDVGQYTIIGSLPATAPPPPVVQFSLASFSANEDDGTTNVVTLTRSGDLSVSSQVQIALAGGTATPGSDYSAAGFPLTVNFAAGQPSQTVPLTLVNDTLLEGSQTVVFELTSLNNVVIGVRNFVTLNIIDSDIATVAFQTAATTVGEDDPATAIVLVLSTAPGNTLESGASFTVSAVNGSAKNNDYDSGSFPKTITFAAGQGNGAIQSVSFAPTSDTLVEGDETVTLSIANGLLLTGGGQTNHLVTIRDADNARVSFQTAATTVGEDDPAPLLTLVLSTAPGNTLESNATLTVTATNGSAESTDYNSGSFPKTVTFVGGQGNGATQTISFAPTSDTLVEGDETVTLSIVNGPLLTGSGQTNHLLTILDADTATVAFQQAATTAGEDNPATALVLVLSTTPGNTLENGTSFTVTATNGSAKNADYDWAAFPKTVTFTAGQGNGTTQAVSFAPTSDTLIEGDETVTLSIVNGPLLTGTGQTSHLITIRDADTASILVVSGQTVFEDGGAQGIAIRLLTTGGNTLEAPLTVTLSASPSAGTEAADAIFGALGGFTFPAGTGNNTTSTVIGFTPQTDALIEGSESVLLSVTGSPLSGQVTYIGNEITILDADTATVAFQTAATTVGEDDPTATLVLALSTALGNTLENGASFTINPANGSAKNADYDSAAFPKTITFTAGQGNGSIQTVSIAPTSDTLIEGDETVTLSIVNGPLLTCSGQTSHLVTIRDADSATILVVPGQTVFEDGGAQGIAIRLLTTGGNTLEAPLTITLSASASAGTEAADAILGTLGSFSFPAGAANNATSTAVRFTPQADTLVEGSESVLLSVTGSPLSGQVTYFGNEITILDADTATVAFQTAGTTLGEEDPVGNLVLVLSTAPGSTLESGATLTINATNGSAENADYDAAAFPKTITFTAGQGNGATQTVSFDPASDTLIEGDETVTLSIASGPLLTGSGQTSHLVTIRDGDSATIAFQQAATTVGEDDPATSLVLVLTTAPGNTLENNTTFTVNATNGSAENADYDAATFPKTITFTAGQGNGATQTGSFDPASDALLEGDETVTLAVTSGPLLTVSGQTTNLLTIRDADTATIAFQQATTTVGEDDPATSLVLVLTTAPGNTLENNTTLTINATNGSAENADYDFGAFPKTITFTAGQGNGSTQTVSFDPASDTLIEGDETVTLSLINDTLLTASGQTSHLVTIRDADTATIAFQAAATTVGEDDPATLLTLVLTTAPGNTLENGAAFTINATNGSAENADYDSATFPRTITFAAGQGTGATQTVSFDLTTDNLVEGDETVTLSIASGPLLTGSGQLNHLLTIHDTDSATVAFQTATATTGEDDPAAALVLVLTTAPGNTLENGATILITATSGSAENADYDFGAFPKTITFNAGQGNGATQTVSFDPASDTLVEGDETVTLTIANGPLLTGSGPLTNLVTIRDADSATIAFQAATTTVGEDDPATAVVLVLSTAPGNTLENNATLSVSAANGSAANNDYDAAAFPKTVTFTAGQGNGATQTVSFDPDSDLLVEGDETVTLTIGNGTLLTGSGQTTQVVTIKDADSGTTVQFSLTSFSANENDGTTSVVTLARSGDVSIPSQVQVTLTGGTATAGSDYSAAAFPLVVSFAAGDLSKTVPLTLVNDTLVEGLQTVLFQVTSIDNAVIGARNATTLHITDGDTATIAFQTVGTTLGEEDPNASLVLVLSTAPGNTLESGATLTINATNGSAENADYDAAAFPKTITFTAGQGNGATQTVSFDPASDTLIEGDETVTLSIASGPLLTGSGQTSHLVTIRDGDSATIAFQQAATTVGEDDPATSLVLILTTAPGNTLENNTTFTVNATNGSAENADYDSATFPKTITFTAGQANGATQTVSFDPASDALVEGDETVTLAVTSGPLLTASGQTTNLLTIRDADAATIAFQQATTTVGEDDPATTLVLVLSTAPGNTLENGASFTINATNGSAENADYDSGTFPKTITFTAGQGTGATQTVSFDPASDTLIEGDETVSLSVASGPLLTASGQTTNLLTIRDADSASIVLVPGQTVSEDGGARGIAVRLLTTDGNTLESPLTVTLSASPSAGTEAADANFGNLGSFSFAAGAGNNITSSPVSFTPNPDTLIEGSELAQLSPTGNSLNGQVTYAANEITILDSDNATISFQTASSAIGEEDPAATLVLILTTVAGNTLENAATITINANNNSAENADYDSNVFPKSVIFPAGQGNATTQTVTFDPANDALVEGDETVTLSISSGFLLTEGGQTTHIVTITDGAVITDEDMPIHISLAAGGSSFSQPAYQIVGWPQHGTLTGNCPNLTYSPTDNFNGSDFFIVKVNPGLPNANDARIRLIVRPVNDEPSFSLTSELSVTDESPAQTIANWATNISSGPPDAGDESTQSVSFSATADNAALFKEPPVIDADGTLRFVPNPNVNGSAEVTVWLTDDNGTASGGQDTSAALSFMIYVAKARTWHNANRRWDVNYNGKVVADDVLSTINFINASGSQHVPTIKTAAGPYYDVTGDGWVAADDVLAIINHINAFGSDDSAQSGASGEATSSFSNASTPPSAAQLPLDELIALMASDVAETAKRRKQ